MAEAEDVHHHISPILGSDEQLLLSGDQTTKATVIVLPVTLAKGLEFQAAILPDASSEEYRSRYEGRLLYIALTCALHQLDILAAGSLTAFLEGSDRPSFPQNDGKTGSLSFPHFEGKGPGDGGLSRTQVHNTL